MMSPLVGVPKVVLDTNVVISAGINSKGIENAIVQLCIVQRLDAIITDDILAEYEAVMTRQRFQRYGFPPSWFQKFKGLLTMVPKPIAAPHLSNDPKDQAFIDVMHAFSATLVTGNMKHVPSFYIGSGLAMTPGAFWTAITPAPAINVPANPNVTVSPSE